MKIGVDLDGVLADFNSAFAGVLERVTGKRVPIGTLPPKSWNWPEQVGLRPEEVKMAIDWVDANPSWWTKLAIIAGENKETIWRLSCLPPEHDVYFITHRGGVRGAKCYSEEWLWDNGFETPTVLLSPTGDHKGHIAAGLDLDAMIDDKPENLVAISAVSPKTVCYLRSQPWNKANPLSARFSKVASVGEYLEKVVGK